MVFRSRFRRKRKMFRRRGSLRRRKARKSARITVKKLLHPELKWGTNNSFTNSVALAGTIVNLAQFGQGDGATQRTGNRILLKSVIASITVYATAAAPYAMIVRFGLFWFNGGTQVPSLSELFDTSSAGAWQGNRNPAFTRSYRMAWNKTVTSNYLGASELKSINVYRKKLRVNRQLIWTAAGGTTYATGAWFPYVFWCGSQTSFTNFVDYSITTRFLDV